MWSEACLYWNQKEHLLWLRSGLQVQNYHSKLKKKSNSSWPCCTNNPVCNFVGFPAEGKDLKMHQLSQMPILLSSYSACFFQLEMEKYWKWITWDWVISSETFAIKFCRKPRFREQPEEQQSPALLTLPGCVKFQGGIFIFRYRVWFYH